MLPPDRDAARPPRFSVVVPVFNVRAYLRDCLDSLLTEDFADVELIAVDDASPDGSGKILDDYARRDPRIRVLHLEHNVGLGGARNAGLDVATGDYVLFLDSDDMLVGGSLRAIAERLEATGDPDVLLFDYVRHYWWGANVRNQLAEYLAETGPEIFTIEARPELLMLLMVVWNKAYRRDFLSANGFRFPAGFYEDLPWTYPTLLAADKIALLDRVCVYYRQRGPESSILKSRSSKHLDVFDQYERIFAFIGGRPELARWQPFMFHRMVCHYETILSSPQRLPAPDRAEFFHRAAAHYRRYLPDGGYRTRPRPRLWSAALRLDSRAGLAVLQVFWRVGAVGRRVGRAGWPRITRGARRLRHWILLAYYACQLLLPVDDKLAVYAAYWYRGYACNPAAIHAKASELVPDVHGVWVVRSDALESLPPGVDAVARYSRGYYRLLARAKYCVNNVNFPTMMIKRKGMVFLQTQHGTPLKTMGLDLQRYPVGANRMSFRKLMRRVQRWDFNLSSNRYSTEVWERAFPSPYETLEYGYPRNDPLVAASADDVARARAEIGLRPGQTAILYTPTFRDYQARFDPLFNLNRFVRALGPEHVLLVRAHYFDHTGPGGDLSRSGRVIDVSAYPAITDLYLAADVLLTDYSSAMFDYALLDRPIVIYAPDWQVYRANRGTYFDLLADPPGAVARSEGELVDLFRAGRIDDAAARRARATFRARFCSYDDGHAAERVVRRVFLDEPDQLDEADDAEEPSVPAEHGETVAPGASAPAGDVGRHERRPRG